MMVNQEAKMDNLVNQTVINTKGNYTVKELETILNNHEKYGWHKLRENPNDLPPTNKCIFVAFNIDGEERYDLSVFGDFIWAHCKITAWRYIEPCEGEDL